MSVLQPLYDVYEWFILRNLEFENIPKHIAVIMDGNRRYARIQDMSPIDGHKQGRNTLENFLQWCVDLKIEIVTIYAFSSNNFNRASDEVQGLMELFKENFKIIAENKRIRDNEIKIKAVGNLSLLPVDVRECITLAEESTSHHKKMLLNIAIGYDGRLEIIDAIKKILTEVKEDKINPEDINEKMVEKNLYTSGLDDPNLIIRTSGEERLSGFLLWQSYSSELYFCDSYWPNFRKTDFLRAIRAYQNKESQNIP